MLYNFVIKWQLMYNLNAIQNNTKTNYIQIRAKIKPVPLGVRTA
ncbi:protein of unknown function [Candidatus Nitrosocosmicus franklandus]|uniref:Uncharacterized protein n=1 Tax=Candidatus Nitrosocosmicus franklandianus TaxID=1798806 RepID=A0A484ICM3_9ARCH|nr:protein of unknown function [Candidatus Nitrosocosmicus franklandus]